MNKHRHRLTRCLVGTVVFRDVLSPVCSSLHTQRKCRSPRGRADGDASSQHTRPSIVLERSLPASLFLHPLRQSRKRRRIHLLALDQAHYQLLARTTKHAIHKISNCVAHRLRLGDRGTVFISTATQSSFQLALALQNVQHPLDCCVGQLLLQTFLHRAHTTRTLPPDHLHDLQFQLVNTSFSLRPTPDLLSS